MPRLIDWFYFIYVNVAFVSQICVLYYLVGMTNIKKNWATYRCNPMYMGFADNIEENFVYCIQNSQSNFMSFLLQPVNYVLSMITGLSGNIMQSIDFIRVMISSIRSSIESVTSGIFGVFMNIIIEFQKIIISIKDLVGKLVGIMSVIIYLVESVMLTMQSTWNGPPGQFVQALCFSPYTIIEMENGFSKQLCDVKIGETLSGGSVVLATMQLVRREHDKLYAIKGNSGNIKVTGSHHVFCDKSGKFIKVEDYYRAYQVDNECEYYCSFLTDDHKIIIDGEIFWDYDDDLLL